LGTVLVDEAIRMKQQLYHVPQPCMAILCSTKACSVTENSHLSN